MRGLIIFGLTDAAELAQFHFRANGTHAIAAFCADGAYLKESSFQGVPVVAVEEIAAAFPPGTHDAFVAIGYSRLNRVRAAKCAAMRAAGYQLASCISHQAIVAPDLVHGDNCFIMEGCVIQLGVRLGHNVTMWSGSTVAHHSTVGDHVFMAPRVAVAGRVAIGNYCFLGINATIRNGLGIGSDCVLSAGSVALHDLPDGTVLDAVSGRMHPIDASRIA